MALTLKRYARMAAYGAYVVGIGAAGLFLLVAYGSRSTAAGGMDATQSWLTWIAVAVPIAAVIAVHVVYARILLRYAQEP